MAKLSLAQSRFLGQLAAENEPSVFSWMSKVKGRLVPAVGGPENWSHFRIATRTYNLGRVSGRVVATISAAEFDDLRDRGLTDACAITDAGRAALSEGK